MRKSSRKIEAVLGITPFVLHAADLPHKPLQPSVQRAQRRHAQVFAVKSSSSSSESDDDRTVVNVSFDSDMDVGNDSYVFVKHSTPHAGYLPHSLPGAGHPKRPRTKSEGAKKLRTNAPLPAAPTRPNAQQKGTSQPILLRFSPPTVRSSNSAASLATTKTASPLSPTDSVFSLAPEVQEARDKEMRRKKLAKLARTLGENVPPELVFSQATTRRSNSSSYPKRISRVGRSPLAAPPSANIALPVAPQSAPVLATGLSPQTKPFKRTHRPRSLSVPLLFPSPTVQVEQIINIHDEKAPRSTTHSLVGMTPLTPLAVVETRGPQLHSPRSRRFSNRLGDMTLDSPRGRFAFEGMLQNAKRSQPANYVPIPSTLSRQAAATVPNTTASLDTCPTTPQGATVNGRSPVDYVYGTSRPRGHGRSQTAAGADVLKEMHRRKEKEWSGEWNVQDMGDVVKRLRELKGR